ncbi:coronin [Plakobranchus ocellatus]|uniref:Coronin n=1 Tax=Plakobranchus ocellatus TaxID=259542 RepID=A0AAV4DGU5_9GAST|nr:coronin [Plakobranchus ocellatus]
MANFLRKSKFRHVFGTPYKRDQCYDGLRITRTSWESTYCCVNPKFVAVITEAAGGGSFLVLPLDKVGRQDINVPMVAGHKGAVLDIAWCPHNDEIIASASEDCTVKIWQIPSAGIIGENLTEPVADLAVHQRRVTLVVWHPSALNVLLSTSSDNTVIFWNIGTEEAMLQIEVPDQIFSVSFNPDGSKFACTCKDKKLRVLDSHTGEIKAGDSIIRFYEITDEAPYVHFLNLYQSKSPQRGIGFMPKRGLNFGSCEIARFYKLHNNGLCEVIPFTVPRKSELFQDDLYPDTASLEPAIYADDFFAGKDALPVLMALKGESTPKRTVKQARKPNVLNQASKTPAAQTSNNASADASAAAPATESAPAPALPPGFDPQAILDDMRKLKLIVKAHERRIKTLEERLQQYESEEEPVDEA